MQIVASDAASSFVAEHGGRLFVWPTANRCCGGGSRLRTATHAPAHTTFESRPEATRFELFLPTAIARVPSELHLELKRFPTRVEAYWNGCAWIV
jgi:hypothetical protein